MQSSTYDAMRGSMVHETIYIYIYIILVILVVNKVQNLAIDKTEIEFLK